MGRAGGPRDREGITAPIVCLYGKLPLFFLFLETSQLVMPRDRLEELRPGCWRPLAARLGGVRGGIIFLLPPI